MPAQSIASRLLCVRHGESEGNRDRRFCPTPEVPLTELGREQARQAASLLQRRFRPQRIVASPYRRARETAEVIAEVLQLPVEVDEGLREQDIGVYAGQPYEAVLQDPHFRTQEPWSWRPPRGESLLDVAARVLPAVERIAMQNSAQEVVLVTHAGVIAALCAAALGRWDQVRNAKNGEVVVLEYRGGRFSLVV